MKTIDYKLTNNVLISTTTKLYDATLPANNNVEGLIIEKQNDLVLFTNDEIPVVIYDNKNDLIFMFKINKEEGLNLKIKDYLNALQKEYNLDFTNVLIYFGPSLDFDECYLNKDELDLLNKIGYLSAAKGTDGKYTYDLKWHLYMILKEYGVLNENFHYSTYQTNQYPDLFYSNVKDNTSNKMATFITRA